jgi:hypothetical protein
MNHQTLFFQERIRQFTTQAQYFQKQDNSYVWIRTIFFLSALILFIWFANDRNAIATAFTCIIVIPIFGILINKHHQIIAQKKHFLALKEINEKEIKRLEGNFYDFKNTGEKYFDETHHCTADLDIFGQNSLFQFLNHTVTPLGERKLADWLKESAGELEILNRQEAIKELSKKVDFLQDFEASGLSFKQNEKETQGFWEWIHKENQFANKIFFRIIAYLLPLFLIVFLGLIAIFDLPLLLIIAPILLNLWVLGKLNEYVKLTLLEVTPLLPTIQAASKLITLVENEHFESKMLVSLKSQLMLSNELVSKEIKKLSQLIENLEFRQNPYFLTFVNIPLLWDLHFVLRLEHWREAHSKSSEKWFEVVATFEALGSLASFSFLYPEYAFPEIAENEFVYEAKDLGHPLIHASKRVTNHFQLANRGTIYIITGSNMSGKSTFQRTVGMNAVLALAGAPVCASQMKLSVLKVFTSMRTHDSLSESVSSFYAELKRIRQLLDHLHDEPPVLFLLDEILKGTNSEDRNKGAKGLIRQLHKNNLSGLVSTHDLELGNMAKENPEYIKNYSFNSELVEQDKLHFPYKISEGVCKSFNASVLMKMIGIEL